MDDIEDLDALAHQMFRQFSRMEYALKTASPKRQGRQGRLGRLCS
jgi:hypothetical protein